MSGSGDNTLRLWDLTTGDCVREFKGHTTYVTSVTLTPDGKHAVSGSDDNTLRLWDLTTGGCVREFKGHTSYVYSVTLTPDGKHAVSGSYDKTLRLWDLTTGDCVKVLNYQTSIYSCAVHLRTPHLYALVGLGDGTLEYRHIHSFAPALAANRSAAATPLSPKTSVKPHRCKRTKNFPRSCCMGTPR